MQVMKFGGSSLANPERFQTVTDLVLQEHSLGPLAVVLSAPRGVTNALIELSSSAARKGDVKAGFAAISKTLHDLRAALAPDDEALKSWLDDHLANAAEQLEAAARLGHCHDALHAELMSRGEWVSCKIMVALLNARGIKADVLDPATFLLTDDAYLDANVLIHESTQRLDALNLDRKTLWVMPGFIGTNVKGELTTLGRNGSDYSAASLAAAWGAKGCQIWTDVDGVYRTDPRLVPAAGPLNHMSYQEAMELSYFGASVLHPKTIAPIAQFHIPCLIKNTLNPSAPGTVIDGEQSLNRPAKALSNLDHMCMVDVSGPGLKGMVGMASRVFAAIAQAGVTVVLITQSSSEYSISFCIHEKDKDKASKALAEAFNLELKSGLLEPVGFTSGLAVVTLIGDGMRHSTGVSATFFTSIAKAKVSVVAIAQGSSERSISAVIKSDGVAPSLRALHQKFFEDKHRLDVFVIGPGVVGSELINQFVRAKSRLNERNIEIKVLGVGRRMGLLLKENGIDPKHWRAEMDESDLETFSVDRLISFAREHQLVSPVVVDTTSNDELASRYSDLLSAGFHVVAASKKANTLEMGYYHEVREAAKKHQRHFLYETNVGAGLPLIETLQNLFIAGDELQKFEGILSGSLSYIFGALDEGMTLSQATKIAREKGYTEPDPRDDLSGMDVARKLLIVARESGFDLSLDDIKIEAVIPDDVAGDDDYESFIKRLPDFDATIKARVDDAAKDGKVLRYVGQIEGGKCRVSIMAVDATHPLGTVKGGENALAVTTLYYQPTPLVLRGYGAGGAVTAAGVFGDILKTRAWLDQ